MNQPVRTKILIPGLILTLVVIAGAAYLLLSPQALPSLETPIPSEPEVQIEQVDDYPLWVMRYRGDYQLQEYIENELALRLPSEPGGKDTWACTVFAALSGPDNLLLGRNFDWKHRQTVLLFADPAEGYDSVSMVDVSYLGVGIDLLDEVEKASLLNAMYIPFDGMNEKGLAVGMMAVNSADGGSDPHKVIISSLSAIRVMLDRASTVEEAIAELSRYNVSFEEVPLHYLVADAGGHSAVIEFIGGEMSVLRNEHPWQVSTNFLLTGLDREQAVHFCDRYEAATLMLEESDGRLSMDDAMSLLEDVSQPHTVWTVVYNLTSGEVWVVMGREYETVYVFDGGGTSEE